MIKGYLSYIEIETFLDALTRAHGGKKLVWIDMDGVVADFEAQGEILAKKEGMTFREWADQKKYRHVVGFYVDLPLIPGAIEAIEKLEASGKYELNFVSACSWGNVSCFSDKRIWIEKHFPTFQKKMDLSYHKGHYMGHYLIDDRTN